MLALKFYCTYIQILYATFFLKLFFIIVYIGIFIHACFATFRTYKVRTLYVELT